MTAALRSMGVSDPSDEVLEMLLTPELRMVGRRTFLKAVAGAGAIAALGTTAIVRGPSRGGPIRAGIVGYGKQGRVLRNSMYPDLMNLVAICDIKPASATDMAESEGVHWYQDWRQMLQRERIEAVLIATPIFTHAVIASGCLEAGKHVLCETAMAGDVSGCRQMIHASQVNRRILQIGYQSFYEPLYWTAYNNIVKQGLLGDVYTVESAWHSHGSGRVDSVPPALNFDPRASGYVSWEQLVNWRLYRRYSNGPTAEWGGALVSLANWFLDAVPVAVQATGGIYSYKDGREVDDHMYATLEYPHGRTATMSVIQSNELEGSYTQIMGTRGTLILSKGEALLFTQGASGPATLGTASRNALQPVVEASASRSAEASNHSVLIRGARTGQVDSGEAFQREIAGFCGAIRSRSPLRSDTARAFDVDLTCFTINSAIQQNKRLNLQGLEANSRVAVLDRANQGSQFA